MSAPARLLVASALAATCTALFAATPDSQTSPRPGFSALDKNSDSTLSREEASAHPRLAESFDRLDTNKDGALSQDELRAARRSRHHAHHAKLDANNDGSISRDESKAAPRLAENFDAVDTNKDGVLSQDELRAARRSGRHAHHAKVDANNDGSISRDESKTAPRLAENFDAMDSNKDGVLTRDELHAWRKAHPRPARAAPEPVQPVKP